MRFVPETVDGRRLITPESLTDMTTSSVPVSHIDDIDVPPIDEAYPYSRQLQAECTGREWLLSDLSVPLETLHQHYLHGYLTYVPGIIKHKQVYECLRCGNNKQRFFAAFSCARCRETCVYCRHCIAMGRVSECTPLIRWRGPEVPQPERPDFTMDWHGELSIAQARAARRVSDVIGRPEALLVWAVCGAGKTEVLFPGMEKALQKGLRICLASPRTDVVLELAPRFAQAFSQTDQAALYGGSDDRGRVAPLTLATTHQLLRFRNYFDVVIVDEVDAFPFSGDDSLAYAVNKAKTAEATTLFLTATPSPSLQHDILQQRLAHVQIPKRYHGHPLPVPRFAWCGHWKKTIQKGRVPGVIRDWTLRQLQRKRPAFLFVPSVTVLQCVVAVLQNIEERITGVHAADDERQMKVQAFRDGQIPIMVTTTILERGVTMPGVEVAVFGANHDVFTEAALVQMSGRVGRSADQPDGDVVFFHYGKTKAMIAAKRHIQGMNQEAFRRG